MCVCARARVCVCMCVCVCVCVCVYVCVSGSETSPSRELLRAMSATDVLRFGFPESEIRMLIEEVCMLTCLDMLLTCPMSHSHTAATRLLVVVAVDECSD
jgi:hypothetical protein